MGIPVIRVGCLCNSFLKLLQVQYLSRFSVCQACGIQSDTVVATTQL